MKTKIAFALCLVFLLPYIAFLHHVISTDHRLLNAIRSLRGGMSVDEIHIALGRDFSESIHENKSDADRSDKYVLRVYMGTVTSRNLLVFLNDKKRITYVTWEPT